MDPERTRQMLKHLGKQNELLMAAHNSISHELHSLMVEEEMLMRKFYELMSALGLTNKNEGGDQVGESTYLLTCAPDTPSVDEGR